MYKIIAIALLTLFFLFKAFLFYRGYKARDKEIPAELKDVYDEDRYLKWKAYKLERLRLSFIYDIIDYVLIVAILSSDIFALLFKNIENPYLSSLPIVGTYIGLTTLIGVIEGAVVTFHVEQRYGFNKASIGTFIADQVKQLLITSILLLGLMCLYIVIYESLGDFILLLFTGVVIAFYLFISFLYPLFSKIFNKFVSLPEGELRDRLIALLNKYGYDVKDIKVMDASRRTARSNAYFAGFGKSKTIVLYDNLLKTMDDDEIVAIFAHEMGHGLHKDTVRNLPMSFLLVAIMVAVLWLLTKFPIIYMDFGFESLSYGMALIIFMNVLAPFISTFLGILTSYISRRHEYAADEQAVKEGYGEQLISGLKKLFREDFGDLTPDPIVVKLSYSHPPLIDRVRHIRECEERLK